MADTEKPDEVKDSHGAHAASSAHEETAAEKEAVETNGTAEPAEKRNNKKRWMTVGIVAAVIVVAFAAFWVWHEQPSFCNAICHSPMDYYVETFDEKDPHFGITPHAENNVTCLKCHEAKLTEQISEVMAWVSDNYPMTDDGVMLASGQEFASEAFCAKSGCHHEKGESFDEITAGLWGFAGNEEKYNPHASHQDLALDCYDCHGIHEANILVCNECHNLNLPEGWEAPNEQ